jgi:hypothetical protein
MRQAIRPDWLTRAVRVFLSSTYEDLVDEREAVYRTLKEQGHDVVRMEDFGSRDDAPLETCLAAVESCEAYILLLGSRYGTIEPTYNLSYTHIEYERARELGIWVLAYVRDGIDEQHDVDQDDYLRLLDFREVIERSHTVRRPYFSSAAQLAQQVVEDLEALAGRIRVRPSLGRQRRAVGEPIAYAGRTVRFTRLRFEPFVAVIADLSVIDAETYPEGRGRRMRRKVREIIDFLDHQGANALVFNEIPATGEGPIVDQRIAEIRGRANLVVALVHGQKDADNLTRFLGGAARVAAWLPDHLETPQIEGVRLASYTQSELQQCLLSLRVQQYLHAVIDEHLLSR